MAVFRLHLNGGPQDDRYVDHWVSDHAVASVRGGLSTIFAALDNDAPPELATRRGLYRLRLDSNGEPVPHDMAGFVEADWQGWED